MQQLLLFFLSLMPVCSPTTGMNRPRLRMRTLTIHFSLSLSASLSLPLSLFLSRLVPDRRNQQAAPGSLARCPGCQDTLRLLLVAAGR